MLSKRRSLLKNRETKECCRQRKGVGIAFVLIAWMNKIVSFWGSDKVAVPPQPFSFLYFYWDITLPLFTIICQTLVCSPKFMKRWALDTQLSSPCLLLSPGRILSVIIPYVDTPSSVLPVLLIAWEEEVITSLGILKVMDHFAKKNVHKQNVASNFMCPQHS